MNKKLALVLFATLIAISMVQGAVPVELDCQPFENSTVKTCEDLDQLGTGMGLLSFKASKGVPILILSLAIVTIVVMIATSIAKVITRSVQPGGKFGK